MRGRGRSIFYTVIIVNILVWAAVFLLLNKWSNIVYELAMAGNEIPSFYDSAKLITIITAGITSIATTAGALIARWGVREGTGNLRQVNLPETAANQIVNGGENE